MTRYFGSRWRLQTVTAGGTYRRVAFAGVLLFCPLTSSFAQVMMRATGPAGTVRINNSDMAVFEAGMERKDLPCVTSPDKAFLGFDLRYHAGYDVSVPLKELSGHENLLTILFRVTPEGHIEDRKYFMQRIRVPEIEDEAKGDAVLQGGFDIGEGNYKVDWLMRDRAERVCASNWDVEATLPDKDRDIALTMSPGVVEQVHSEQFREEPPVVRSSGELLNVKVLVNFAPQNATAATMRPVDTSALISILRTISREPRIGKFTLVAFNLDEQRVFFREDNVDKIDFPALGDSMESLNLGTVDLKRLGQKHGDTEFLANLVTKEVGDTDKADALIFAGPKAMLDENVSKDDLERLGRLNYPVFYMNYALNPRATPWRDAIGNIVKVLKGYEYTISKPRELWFAVTEMVSKIALFRNQHEVAEVH